MFHFLLGASEGGMSRMANGGHNEAVLEFRVQLQQALAASAEFVSGDESCLATGKL